MITVVLLGLVYYMLGLNRSRDSRGLLQAKFSDAELYIGERGVFALACFCGRYVCPSIFNWSIMNLK